MVDLNGDSRVDLVRASATTFGIFFQDKGGRFVAAKVARVDLLGTEIVSVAVGSIVTGKHRDVVIAHLDGRVMIYPNTGTTFGKPWTLPKIAGSLKPAVAEVFVGNLDRVGVDEIILTLNHERPVVFKVATANTFTQARVVRGPLLQRPRSVLADLDRDGDLDLLSVSAVTAAYPAVYGNDRGTLKASTTAFPATTRLAASQVVVASVLGKSGPELMLGPLSATAASVRMFRNTSTTAGKLTYAYHGTTSLFRVARPRALVAADVNGDRFPDLLAINANGSVVLGLNTARSPGTFRAAKTLLTAGPRTGLCAVDMDRDRDVDLFVGGFGIEDSLLLGRGAAGLLDRDTESRGMPIGSLNRALIGVTDVTGEGDPDLVSWDRVGRGGMLRNVSGQARFERVPSTRVPTLPLASYIDVQNAAIATKLDRDLLVLGYPSVNNTTGMRTVVRRSTGQLVDETRLRWRNSIKFVSMTVGDVAGHVIGSAGAAGYSDVVGLDGLGNIVMVINGKGLFSRAVLVSTTKAKYGSKVLIGDVNFDTRPDLVIVQPTARVRVLLADPKNADKFIERAGPAVIARTGILEDVTGDFYPDLVLSVPGASSKVRLWVGGSNGSFVDRTSVFMPKLGTKLGVVTDLATIGSANTRVKSLVLGFQGARDRIMRPTNRIFGVPTILPMRGSSRTSRLIVRDLDLDGDDDVVVARFDSYPALLLGQSFQFTHRGGLSQLGREAAMHIALPDLQTFGVVVIGYPVVRFRLPGMGVVRMGRFSVLLPMPNPPRTLVHEIRLPVPTGIALTPIPMQLFTIKNGRIQFRNLDLFTPTAH
jgi:FG-GAP-like repeat